MALPMMGIIITANNVGGNNDKPVSYAVKPNTLCASTGYTNTEVNKPKPATKVNMVVNARLRLFNTLRFTAGFGVLISRTIKLTKPMAAIIAQIRMGPLLNQSSDSPLSNTNCKQPMPAISMAMPG